MKPKDVIDFVLNWHTYPMPESIRESLADHLDMRDDQMKADLIAMFTTRYGLDQDDVADDVEAIFRDGFVAENEKEDA